jgi:hypothetical protein
MNMSFIMEFPVNVYLIPITTLILSHILIHFNYVTSRGPMSSYGTKQLLLFEVSKFI